MKWSLKAVSSPLWMGTLRTLDQAMPTAVWAWESRQRSTFHQRSNLFPKILLYPNAFPFLLHATQYFFVEVHEFPGHQFEPITSSRLYRVDCCVAQTWKTSQSHKLSWWVCYTVQLVIECRGAVPLRNVPSNFQRIFVALVARNVAQNTIHCHCCSLKKLQPPLKILTANLQSKFSRVLRFVLLETILTQRKSVFGSAIETPRKHTFLLCGHLHLEWAVNAMNSRAVVIARIRAC